MIEQFIELAMELDVLGVVFAEIGSRYGLLRDDGVIVLNRSDPEDVQRVALCHELGHWVSRHASPSRCESGRLRQEEEADEAAAIMLIDGPAYRVAKARVGSAPSALARELGVPVRIVRAWRRAAAAERVLAA